MFRLCLRSRWWCRVIPSSIVSLNEMLARPSAALFFFSEIVQEKSHLCKTNQHFVYLNLKNNAIV